MDRHEGVVAGTAAGAALAVVVAAVALGVGRTSPDAGDSATRRPADAAADCRAIAAMHADYPADIRGSSVAAAAAPFVEDGHRLVVIRRARHTVEAVALRPDGSADPLLELMAGGRGGWLLSAYVTCAEERPGSG